MTCFEIFRSRSPKEKHAYQTILRSHIQTAIQICNNQYAYGRIIEKDRGSECKNQMIDEVFDTFEIKRSLIMKG